MWCRLRHLSTNLAAAFCTIWSFSLRLLGVPVWEYKCRNQRSGHVAGEVLTSGSNTTQFFVSRCVAGAKLGKHSILTPKFLVWLANLISDRTTRIKVGTDSAVDARLNVASIASVFLTLSRLHLVLCHSRFDTTHIFLHFVNSTLSKIRCVRPIELCVIRRSIVANRMTGESLIEEHYT